MFILKTLKEIFRKKLFENHSSDKFEWVGAEKRSVILLKDYRWDRETL